MLLRAVVSLRRGRRAARTRGYTRFMSTALAEVTALPATETSEFLARFGLVNALADGSLLCSICQLPLRDAGIGAARLSHGEIVFACEKLDCQEDFHRVG